jgi:DNA-binding NarL/FixJ family response regulator
MPEAVKQTIEILVVDDHALFRESVARLLSAEPGFKVVAHCASIATALQTVRQRHIDVVLLDFDLESAKVRNSFVWRNSRGLAANTDRDRRRGR